MKVLDKEILNIAIPSIASNVTVPLLGIVDTAITGHLGSPAYIGAIAVGTSIFSLCYWLFSFLRMGTGGITAQAFGRKSWAMCVDVLRKALCIATVAGVVIIALQQVIADIALWLIGADSEVERWARVYFTILVWGAPANLGLSALNGWFIGRQNAKIPMTIAISQNVVNIAISTLLVLGFGWKVEGVATGTLIAQWCGFLAAIVAVGVMFRRQKSKVGEAAAKAEVRPSNLVDENISWGRFFAINRDIFLRTACLIAVMFSFTAFGAREGDNLLSVNALIMQLFMLVSYIMDGFAYSAEALGGNFVGAGNRDGFDALTRRLFVWGGATAAAFTLTFLLAGEGIVCLFTDDVSLRASAAEYLWVAVAIPFVSLGAFVYDGIFIGTTSTREMLVSISVATLLYFTIVTVGSGNTMLWAGFLSYLAARGGVQHLLMGKIKARLF